MLGGCGRSVGSVSVGLPIKKAIKRAGDAAQLVEYLSSTHEDLNSIPRVWRKENQKFKVILAYIVGSSPVWDT